MDTEELNQKLYARMSAEQYEYRSWLLGQKPEEILNHTFKYTAREDILMQMSERNLPAAQAAALLNSPYPLADVYKDCSKQDIDQSETIRDCFKERAKKLLELRQNQPERRAKRLPIKAQLATKPVPGGNSPAKKSKDCEVR